MPERPLRLFVSATSFDLEECRLLVRDALLEQNVFPVVQNHFPPDYRELVEYLRDQVAACDATLCLVGEVFGAAPQSDGARSYTQIEYDVARELEKPVFVFLTAADFEPRRTKDEPEAAQLAQRRHREALLAAHKCEFVASPGEVREKLLKIVPALHRLAGRRALFYLHPPALPAYFAGRKLEMEQLAARLRADRPSAIAVVGMGGQGKTALVRRTLEERRDLPFAAGFWCSAERGGFGFDDFLDEALAYFAADRFDKRSLPEIERRVAALLGELQRRPCLIVIDGLERWLRGWGRKDALLAGPVDDEALRRGNDEGLDGFLEGAAGLSNGSHVVVTTRALPASWDRRAAVVPVRDPGDSLGLDGLDPPDAAALLRELGVRGDESELRDAAARYGNHPLALETLAGLLVQREGGDVRRAPRRLALDAKRRLFDLLDTTRRSLPTRRRAERLLRVASHFVEDPPLGLLCEALRSDAPLERLRRTVERVRFAFAVWMPVRVPSRPDCSAAEVERVEETVATLRQWNLLAWDGRTKLLKLHPLVKEFFGGERARVRSLDQVLGELYRNLPLADAPATLEDVRPWRLALEHALLSRDAAAIEELLFAPRFGGSSPVEWMSRFGHQATGAALLARAAETPGVQNRARLLGAAGALLGEIGRFESALATLDAAVAACENGRGAVERDPGNERPRTLASIHQNRGNVLRSCKRMAEAERDLDRAVELLRGVAASRPLERAAFAKALTNRGNLVRDRGELTRAARDYDEAVRQLDEAPDDRARAAGEPATRLAQAICLADLWDHSRALPEFERCLKAYDERILAEGERWRGPRAYAEAMYGSALADAGRIDEATERSERALEILRSLVDSGRSDFEEPLALAAIASAQTNLLAGRWEAADRESRAAIALLGSRPESPRAKANGDLGHALALRSEALTGLRRFDEARSRRDEALKRLEETLADGVFDNVAVLLRKTVAAAIQSLDVDPDDARRLVDRASEYAERELARDPPIETAVREIVRSFGRLQPHLHDPTFARQSHRNFRLREAARALYDGAAAPTGVRGGGFEQENGDVS